MAASFAFIACKNTDKKSESVASTVSTTTQDTIVYEHEYIVKVGDIAPDFTLSYTDGTPFSLSALRGKVIMLQFTASWCGICRGEMPHIESRIWQPHKENPDFVLVGVDREETREVVEKYTAQLGTNTSTSICSIRIAQVRHHTQRTHRSRRTHRQAHPSVCRARVRRLSHHHRQSAGKVIHDSIHSAVLRIFVYHIIEPSQKATNKHFG